MPDPATNPLPRRVDPDDDRPTMISVNRFLAEQPAKIWRRCPATIVLIALSCAVALYSSLGANSQSLLPLFISLSPVSGAAGTLVEVRHGEVWRLLTPMFIHFGLWHIAFNMLWIKEIGGAVEYRQRTGFFVLLVVVLSLAADLLQFAFEGPFFGGMSGVVYGLFGYVWMRARYSPLSGYLMPNQTVLVMVGWFVLCALHIIPNVANIAHGAGLVVGMLWGFIEAKAAAAGPRRANEGGQPF